MWFGGYPPTNHIEVCPVDLTSKTWEFVYHISHINRRIKMGQGDFTKEEAKETEKAFKEVFDALPKKKQVDYLGHANDVFLFLEACKKKCPG